MADQVQRYSARRTMPRPPRMDRCPRFWPLSRDQGARPTREVKALLSHWPSSGRWETRIAAVNGPIPGTVRYKEARWARGGERSAQRRLVLPVQSSNLLLQPSDVAFGRFDYGGGNTLVQSAQFLNSLVHQPPPPQQVPQFLAFRFQLRLIRIRKHSAVVGQHLGVLGVGFGFVAAGPREGAHLNRVGHVCRYFGLP